MVDSLQINSEFSYGSMCTWSTSTVIGLGPLEEKETTNGANFSSTSSLLKMVAVGLLYGTNN